MKSIVALIVTIVIIVIVLSIVSAVIMGILKVINGLNRLANTTRGTINTVSHIVDMAKAADEEQMTTPKSLSAIESVLEPKIRKDFPEFNFELSKTHIKNFFISYLESMSSGDTEDIEKYCSKQFKEAVISQAKSSKVSYKNIIVHKVVISAYRRDGEEAVIEYQLAAQYNANNSQKTSQEKYTITYSYFLEYGAKGENVSLECPICGAGISKVGLKVCPFCDSLLPASIERTWKVTDVRRSTYH